MAPGEAGAQDAPKDAPVTAALDALALCKVEDEWLASIQKLVQEHSLEAVQAWHDKGNKHQHRLIHLAVAKNFAGVVELLKELGFDINVPRASDQCTPLHLAMWYRKPKMIKTLVKLGADLTLKNAHGEACDTKYEQWTSSFQNIIWLDLELTCGHYEPEDGRILEAAVIVTDKDLNELGRGHWVIGGFSEEELKALPEFHQRNFRDAQEGGRFPPLTGCKGNGLFTGMMESTTTLEQATKEVLKLLQLHCPEQACPIAGNSVQCDREVLKVQMPAVYRYLSHQIIDVSTFIGIASRWLPEKYDTHREDSAKNSNYNHRATQDVEASIQSMRWVRSNLLAQ